MLFPLWFELFPMPHKHNADRRHHIPKMSFKVRNWPAYEAGLRGRGSLTLWIEDAALACWQTTGPDAQARYSYAAVQTNLMLRTAFTLAMRQTEGLMASVITLMDLTISAPDHTTISRRAVTLPGIQPDSVPHGPLHLLIDSTGLQVYGAGQWLEAKHGAKSRRKWRKLHLAVDAANGMIVAQTLTDQDVDDPSQVAPLLDQIDGRIARVTADGAYDGAPTYATIAAHGNDIEVVIPPRSTAVPGDELGPLAQRDRHLEMITKRGRLAWQKATDYGQRSLVETTMGRYKALIGPRLRARGFVRGIAIIDGKAVTLFDGLPPSASRACMDSGKRKRDRGPRLPPASQGGGWPSIGIGGRLTTPPLPHHRAYGSVPRRFGGLSTRGCRAFGFGHRRGHFDLSHGRTRGFTPARYRQVQRKLEWRSHCGHETSELLALSFNPSSGTVRAFGRRSSLLCPLLTSAPRSGGLAAPSVRPGFPVGHGADLLG